MTTEQAWTTTITKIDPIPGKDRIVLATVEGYQSIIGADQYKVGDRVCYISEQTLVPVALQQELGLEGRLAGSNKDRIKPIRMGGVLSQGIVCTPVAWVFWQQQVDSGQVVAPLDEVLGVSRYQPSIPVHLSGKVARPKGNAPIVPMYDVENIKKKRHWSVPVDAEASRAAKQTVYKDDAEGQWSDPFDGKRVVVTEKLHGTNIAIHMNAGDDDVYVYSKGLGQNGHVLIEDENNTYWRALRKYPAIIEMMTRIIKEDGEQAVTVYGEVVGRGIQDMNYGIQDIELYVFDVRLWKPVNDICHAHAWQLEAWKRINGYDFLTVPVVYTGIYDYDKIVELACAPSVLDGGLREGVTVVSDEGDFYNVDGSRRIVKFINPEYLTRKSGTEYQ